MESERQANAAELKRKDEQIAMLKRQIESIQYAR